MVLVTIRGIDKNDQPVGYNNAFLITILIMANHTIPTLLFTYSLPLSVVCYVVVFKFTNDTMKTIERGCRYDLATPV